MPKIVRCNRLDADQILSILNDAILTTTAIYDYAPRTSDSMQGWFDAKERSNFPVIGLKDSAGDILAFGSYGQFRAWPAYKYTVEHSLYVRRDKRGAGLGTQILGALIDAANKQGLHNLIAGIDSENAESIALHTKFGFKACGTIKHAGFKFNRWLDLAFFQKVLDGPSHPEDG